MVSQTTAPLGHNDALGQSLAFSDLHIISGSLGLYGMGVGQRCHSIFLFFVRGSISLARFMLNILQSLGYKLGTVIVIDEYFRVRVIRDPYAWEIRI